MSWNLKTRITYVEKKREDESKRSHGQHVDEHVSDRVGHLGDDKSLETGVEVLEEGTASARREMNDVGERVFWEHRADLGGNEILKDGPSDAKSREDAGNLGCLRAIHLVSNEGLKERNVAPARYG